MQETGDIINGPGGVGWWGGEGIVKLSYKAEMLRGESMHGIDGIRGIHADGRGTLALAWSDCAD